jgi:hypothetical protein
MQQVDGAKLRFRYAVGTPEIESRGVRLALVLASVLEYRVDFLL